MKTANCPICQSRECSYYQALENYTLAKCRQCGMVWDNNPPTEPTAIYQANYYQNEGGKGGYSDYLATMKANSQTFRRRLLAAQRKLGSDVASATLRERPLLLDIGCALGDCLLEAKKLGWENPLGLEVSEYAVEFARSRDLLVFRGDLFNHPFQPNSFDLITLQDMLEHTTNPLSQLEAAYQLLKPGGLILITTPNVEGILAKILRSFWYHYKPGEHLTYFSFNTINLALEKTGFFQIESQPTSKSLSVEYIFDRLKYYQPQIFSILLKLARQLNLDRLVFEVGTGELEAWGKKPETRLEKNRVS
jgi:SAM-dependent methyltransferase